MGRLLDNIKSVFNTQGDNITEAIGNIESSSGDSDSSNIVLLSSDASTMTLGATYNEIKTYLEEGKIPTLFSSMQQEESYVVGIFFLAQLRIENDKYAAILQGFSGIRAFSSSSPDENLAFDQSLTLDFSGHNK